MKEQHILSEASLLLLKQIFKTPRRVVPTHSFEEALRPSVSAEHPQLTAHTQQPVTHGRQAHQFWLSPPFGPYDATKQPAAVDPFFSRPKLIASQTKLCEPKGCGSWDCYKPYTKMLREAGQTQLVTEDSNSRAHAKHLMQITLNTHLASNDCLESRQEHGCSCCGSILALEQDQIVITIHKDTSTIAKRLVIAEPALLHPRQDPVRHMAMPTERQLDRAPTLYKLFTFPIHTAMDAKCQGWGLFQCSQGR